MSKNHTRTRVCLALAVVMLASPAASPGSAQDVTFTATTGAGMMYGVARELVYSVYKSESGLLSELDWDLRPLAYAKAALTVNAGRGFVASVDVRLGIPAKTGLMTDSDWKNYPYNGSTAKTHYSQNDCFSERAILLDSQIGWQFPLAGWITLRPFVGFDFMEFKWSARDGYYEYPPEGKPPYTPWYSGENHLPMSGVSIVYQQTWFIPAAGVEAKLRFGNDLSASVAFAFSPVLFCNDLDDHIFARYAFYDYSWGGFMLEPKVSLDWEVTPRTRLSLAVSFRHIEGLVGTTYVVETGAPATPDLVADKRKNGAGASFDALDASLSFTLTL